jgi:hypothetical protein
MEWPLAICKYLENFRLPFSQNVNLSIPCSWRAVFDVLVMDPTPPVAITLAGIWN